MVELRALITCRHVWSDEDAVRRRLADSGVAVDIPHFDGQQLEEDDLLAILYQYHGILAGDDHLTRAVLESAPDLRVVAKWGVGIDGIDTEAADDLGKRVLNTPGMFGEELADYAMGFIHMLARRQHEVNAKVKGGVWHQVRGVSLVGKTLGIVGLGSSGRALVRRGLASSMKVIGSDVVKVDGVEGCETVSFDQVLELADIISLHLPATDQTRHLIDSAAIARMKPGVWLINTSRGSLIDESALVEAFHAGAVGGAALDVFESEPVSSSNPLLAFDDVIVGAHNGSNTQEAVEKTTWQAVSNLLLGLGIEDSAP